MIYEKVICFFIISNFIRSFLNGCVVLDSKDDAKMLKLASRATGYESSDLTIIPGSVDFTFDTVEYRVEAADGNRYSCYFTTAFNGNNSDAFCTELKTVNKDTAKSNKNSKTDKKSKKTKCNELLEAAGKC